MYTGQYITVGSVEDELFVFLVDLEDLVVLDPLCDGTVVRWVGNVTDG